MLSGGPLSVEPWQVQLERVLPDAEDIRALTAQHLADDAAAAAGATDDLLDCDPILREPQNDGVVLLTAKVSFVLNLLGSHACAVAGSRSGSRAIVLRRSRSQTMVP